MREIMERYFWPARIHVLVLLLATASATSALAQGFSASADGNDIVLTIGGGLKGIPCCRGGGVDEPFALQIQCSQPCPANSAVTERFECNSVGTHVVYGAVLDQDTGYQYVYSSTTVEVTTPPAPSCPVFRLVAPDTQVLTHRYGAGINADLTKYPGKLQTTDGELTMRLRTVRALPGTVVHLKVADPPQSSAYGAPNAKDDNIDVGRGIINGANTATVTLPEHGAVDFVLQGTLNVSGDNYQVQASADPALASDPNFVCDAAHFCQKSQVITAWKRFYLELNEMYRDSQLIARAVLPGERFVYVNERGFGRNDQVRLIHAPSYQRNTPGDSVGFYSEDHVIRRVRRNQNPNIPGTFEIELQNGVLGSYKTDNPVAGTPLGDAIVNLSNGDPFFHMDEQYVTGAFAEAFVDVVKIGTNGVGIPHYEAMTNNNMIFAAAKWFFLRETILIPPNSGFAVAAATRAPLDPPNQNALSLGTTLGPYSYVWRQSINEATAGPRHQFPLTSGHNPSLMSGEVLVHELAHQWNVNPNYIVGECTQNSYADSTRYCQMNSPENSAQYDDTKVKFHYVGTTPMNADSEYMTIRRADEPKP
jgi:hypothetical protein